MNPRRNPFTIVALVSGCYEFVLALFILFQILLALLALEVAKVLPIGWPLSWSRRIQHNSFCSGHFPPFSPCREREGGRLIPSTRTPTHFSRGSVLGGAISNDPVSRCVTELTFSRKAGFGNQTKNFSFSSSYRRKYRQNRASASEGCASRHKGSVDGESCQCIAPSLDFYDDLIEVSSEYLKQKDRGHEEVILSLLKALQVERRNLRFLYEELDEERIASETAANEAMSMILRLQEEKSALQMEADHYQRMAEEKAIHDEHAIEILEENLCRKENERLLLEEELIKLRRRADSNDDLRDTTENTEKLPPGSVVTRHLLLLTDDTDEALGPVEQVAVSVRQTQESRGSQCSSLSSEDYCEDFPSPHVCLEGLNSVAQCERIGNPKDFLFLHENIASVLGGPHDQDDTETIINQLSIVEKQLIDLEESEKLETWQQARVSRLSLLNNFLSPDSCIGLHVNAKGDNYGDSQLQTNTVRTADVNTSTMFDEERVVKIDVANVIIGSSCEKQGLASGEMLEIHENQYQRSKSVQWEISEEEKHLDLLSCVKNGDSKGLTSLIEESCTPLSEEEDWNTKRVTLEGINSRLQALESESTILWHHSAPSNHEHGNLVLLKDIIQELQDLLKANKNVANEAIISTAADAKGDCQYRKRHYLDGPGQLL